MMAANGMIRRAYPSDILPMHENLFGNTHVRFRDIDLILLMYNS
jgi:hypothetical protein